MCTAVIHLPVHHLTSLFPVFRGPSDRGGECEMPGALHVGGYHSGRRVTGSVTDDTCRVRRDADQQQALGKTKGDTHLSTSVRHNCPIVAKWTGESRLICIPSLGKCD